MNQRRADQRLRRSHLDQSPTFGTLGQYSEQWLLQLLRRCVTAGWVDFQGGDRPVVVITEQGLATIHANHPVNLLLPPSKMPGPQPQTSRPILADRAPAADSLDRDGHNLFEALRRHRLEVARTEGMPPYVIASDRTLRDIAHLRPQTLDELELAHGIGPAKLEKYGADLIAVVTSTPVSEQE